MTKQIKFYAIDENGNKVLLNTQKIHIEYSTGENLTIEDLSNYKIDTDPRELVLHSYYGEDRMRVPDDDGKLIDTSIIMYPGATNIVAISLATREVKVCDSKRRQ